MCEGAETMVTKAPSGGGGRQDDVSFSRPPTALSVTRERARPSSSSSSPPSHAMSAPIRAVYGSRFENAPGCVRWLHVSLLCCRRLYFYELDLSHRDVMMGTSTSGGTHPPPAPPPPSSSSMCQGGVGGGSASRGHSKHHRSVDARLSNASSEDGLYSPSPLHASTFHCRDDDGGHGSMLLSAVRSGSYGAEVSRMSKRTHTNEAEEETQEDEEEYEVTRAHTMVQTSHGLYSGVELPNPYVLLSTLSETHHSRTKFHTLDPDFHEEFIFKIDDPSIDALHITVMTDTIFGSRMLGHCVLSMRNVPCGRPCYRHASLVVHSHEATARERGELFYAVHGEGFGMDCLPAHDAENRLRERVRELLLLNRPQQLHALEYYVGNFAEMESMPLNMILGKSSALFASAQSAELHVGISHVSHLLANGLLIDGTCTVEVSVVDGSRRSRMQAVSGVKGEFIVQQSCVLRVRDAFTAMVQLTVYANGRNKVGICYLSLSDLHRGVPQRRTHTLVAHARSAHPIPAGYIHVTLLSDNFGSDTQPQSHSEEEKYTRLRHYVAYYMPAELATVAVRFATLLNVDAYLQRLVTTHGPEPGRYPLRLTVQSWTTMTMSTRARLSPFCIVRCGLDEFRTAIASDETNYVFDETFDLTVGLPQLDKVEVIMMNVLPAKNVEIGRTQVQLDRLPCGQRAVLHLPIVSEVGTQKAQVHGALTLVLYTDAFGIRVGEGGGSENSSIYNNPDDHTHFHSDSSNNHNDNNDVIHNAHDGHDVGTESDMPACSVKGHRDAQTHHTSHACAHNSNTIMFEAAHNAGESVDDVCWCAQSNMPPPPYSASTSLAGSVCTSASPGERECAAEAQSGGIADADADADHPHPHPRPHHRGAVMRVRHVNCASELCSTQCEGGGHRVTLPSRSRPSLVAAAVASADSAADVLDSTEAETQLLHSVTTSREDTETVGGDDANSVHVPPTHLTRAAVAALEHTKAAAVPSRHVDPLHVQRAEESVTADAPPPMVSLVTVQSSGALSTPTTERTREDTVHTTVTATTATTTMVGDDTDQHRRGMCVNGGDADTHGGDGLAEDGVDASDGAQRHRKEKARATTYDKDDEEEENDYSRRAGYEETYSPESSTVTRAGTARRSCSDVAAGTQQRHQHHHRHDHDSARLGADTGVAGDCVRVSIVGFTHVETTLGKVTLQVTNQSRVLLRTRPYTLRSVSAQSNIGFTLPKSCPIQSEAFTLKLARKGVLKSRAVCYVDFSLALCRPGRTPTSKRLRLYDDGYRFLGFCHMMVYVPPPCRPARHPVRPPHRGIRFAQSGPCRGVLLLGKKHPRDDRRQEVPVECDIGGRPR